MSADATMIDTAAAVPAKGRSVLRRLLTNPQGMICIVFLLLVILFGVLSPLLAPYQPNQADLNAVNAAPFSEGHLLGADRAGRDILSQLMWGTNGTLLGSVLVLVISVLLGVTTGLLSGFYRGRFEAVAGFITDLIMSLPSIVLLIALFTLTGPNVMVAMAVFGVLVAPTYYRLVRSVVLGVRTELYIDAAKVVGLSDQRIIGRHVLWAVRAPVVIQSSFVAAAGIAIQAGLEFLGLGDPEQPSWGGILDNANSNIYNNRFGVLWPALLISLTILALVLLGNVLRDVLQSSAHNKTLKRSRRRALLNGAQAARTTSSPAKSEEALLSIRGLKVGYPDGPDRVRTVVHGVDLDVRRGEIHGLVGESGSGKSQMAFSTLGILPKEALVLGGSIYLEGEDLLADDKALKNARGRRIGYIPQEPMSNLDPSFTIGAQLVYGLRAVKKISDKQAKAQLIAILTRVGIRNPENVMRLYPHEISGGMAQRVLICGAVAGDPDLIVADEPTTALDVTVQAEVLELLRELSTERGLAMILVTHNLGVVADLCDTVSVMKNGRIVERNDVESLFSDPKQDYTKVLLESSRSVELMEA
ncbi:dipeptide/oligopeptide/nickel ABC transporter permease/ATP-binding protein [Paenarthrobacter aromaticivorans]|uniref:Dipeptide/oligopeptide/nickel ABC transporter permease/ATP-binding protein n=1 Tax=Paenarthrobacter aromaticivorans TaxID=2849150 RepID=A0ABS6I1R8_9MICC|nr:dipeptide/oligopeptide/nickel ABC transporter permease/ATP-binding protein [Paenarthrobacter sp. MMS21-TAE1-1]MBU8865685.1 dipeptide/oligopeptide/nickel ABC transporter permease/ATP-binding protein [Paenarthrobacter sp. MMS21-TAE1-1]